MSVDQYAVVGNPISHSKSPLIHQLFAEQTGETLAYSRIEAPLDGFADTVKAFFGEARNKGLNVTVPFKEDAFAMCQVLTPRAAFAEAVNTLFMHDGMLHGDNTDGCGLVNDLQKNHQVAIAGKSVLLLGAGGAAKGVFQPLMSASPKTLVVTNRTFAKAEALVGRYKETFSENTDTECLALRIDELAGPFDLVINATSASLSGASPIISPDVITTHTIVYDMMYSSEQTVFNAWAQSHGASRCLDGLGMLVEQAAEAFRVWRGVQPDTTSCFTLLNRQ